MNYFLLAALLATATAANVQPREYYEKMFFEHMQQFGLKFADGKEFIKRLEIFASNIDLIEKHNADKTQTYQMGVNQFTHLTFDEFIDTARIGGVRPPYLRRSSDNKVFEAPATTSNPTSVDWVSTGAVTDVKNQGSCGSCWSFSTTGALEGAYKLAGNDLTSFSEQELVSCDTTDAGCNGGWMDDAFTYIKNAGGLTSEDNYPYTSGSGTTGTCQKSKISPVSGSKVSSYTDVKAGSVSSLETALAQQPVSIAIQANQLAFQTYKSGVLTGTCGQRLDHGVLAVGYGTDDATGLDYWKVKNSWGDSWGEAGYIRILKSSADLCGVLDAASFPTL